MLPAGNRLCFWTPGAYRGAYPQNNAWELLPDLMTLLQLFGDEAVVEWDRDVAPYLQPLEWRACAVIWIGLSDHVGAVWLGEPYPYVSRLRAGGWEISEQSDEGLVLPVRELRAIGAPIRRS